MILHRDEFLDLMPPPFAEGLDDWSRGDGTPESPTYDGTVSARIARGDPDFSVCLELRKTEPVQRLRYMGEVPIRAGAFVKVRGRVKLMRGAKLMVRGAAWPGSVGGTGVGDLPSAGALVPVEAEGVPVEIALVIGPEKLPGVDLVWDRRAAYAHVGLDVVGLDHAVIRIENLAVREVTARFGRDGRVMPGFEAETGAIGGQTRAKRPAR